ncbi:MAG TPA: hypothetical protein VNJ03_00015 [Vicinamibacterales bacterium]|nr:hypothetical protein [Vicinamibacterales bacterium]
MPPIRKVWLVVAVVLAACVPYLSSIRDYFAQDDFGTVMILAKRSWTTFPRWFVMPWMEYIWGYTPDEIRPFVAFTYQLTGKWAPHRPELHHIVNIAMHAGNALLVMAIGRAAVGLSPVAAAFAAIVFAVLPSQPESVAWITGRVDSMPAFFYLATFLAYVHFRRSPAQQSFDLTLLGAGRHATIFHPPAAYLAALALFFITLFSKQNAITMVATLAAYDLLVLGRERRGSLWWTVAAWTPFILMTAGYLALRRAVFGHTVRGGIDSVHDIEAFFGMVERHLLRVTVGHLSPILSWEVWAAVFLLALVTFAMWREPRFTRRVLCFSVAWWAIGVAPILVAGYESPRHVYLASVAWAFLLALVADAVVPRLQRPWLRIMAATIGLAVVAVYVVQLRATLEDWHALARISRNAVERVREEALSAPEGTLLLVGVPRSSWEWGVPFVMQPPYQPTDLTARVRLVTPWRLYCCGAEQWDVYARRHLQAWLDAPNRPPLVALHFAPDTGHVSRLTEAESPELRELIPVLLQTDTPETLDGAIVHLLERVVKK